MRICRIAKRYPPLPGGMELHEQYLSWQQAASGHRIDLFVLMGSNRGSRSGMQVYPAIAGALWRRIQIESLLSLALIAHALPRAIIGRLRGRYHVIHAHGDFIEALIARVLGWFFRIPAVLTVHAGLRSDGIYRRLAAPAFRSLDAVIAVGDNIAVQVEHLGVPKDRITVTHSGIWCERYRSSDERAAVRRELDITDDEFVIVNLARLHALKGQTYLIDALSTLSESMSATLVVVGDGPERETLEAQSNACGARVVFVGDQPHDQVPRYLAAADIFALTSVSLPGQQEGFNTSIKEAMAAGLPIVSTTTGSIPSYVIEPDNGVLVPERDGEAIATAIKRLASSRDLRLTIGATNKYQAQSYDWSVVSKEMDKAYERAGAVQ